jgi:hypothetical protein
MSQLEIVLSDRCFKALISHCETTSQLPSTFIEEILWQKLNQKPIDSEPTQNQLQDLESRLIQLIDRTINAQLDIRLGNIAQPPIQGEVNPNSELATLETESLPKIHQLQIGDSVQIRDADSNYFNQVVQIIQVGMIRATVETPTGAESYLKRDLRYQES